MATNDIKAFSAAGGANVLTQAEYLAIAALSTGFTSGKASSKEVNKVLRQSSFVAAAVAQFISDSASVDVLDDGNVSGLVAKLIDALSAHSLTRNHPFADIKSDGAAAISEALSNLGLTYTSSLNSPGWYKLPGGLIIQWFSGPGLAANGSQVVTYPIPFPSTMLGIACTPGATAPGGGTYGIQSIDPASCRIWNQSTTQAAQAGSIIALGK